MVKCLVDSNGWRIRPPKKILASSIAELSFDLDFPVVGEVVLDDTLVGLRAKSSLVMLVAGVWKNASLGVMVLGIQIVQIPWYRRSCL